MSDLKLPDEMYIEQTMSNGHTVTICTMRQEVLHCIGMIDSCSQRHKPYRRHGKVFYQPWRNYFDTNADDKVWSQLCDAGYAEHGEVSDNGGAMFWLTRKGLDWVGEQLNITIHDEEI